MMGLAAGAGHGDPACLQRAGLDQPLGVAVPRGESREEWIRMACFEFAKYQFETRLGRIEDERKFWQWRISSEPSVEEEAKAHIVEVCSETEASG